MEWYVFYESLSSGQISTFNIFNHVEFHKDVVRAFKGCKDKDVFAEKVRRSLFYYFCSKCEWEVVISPWVGKKDGKEIKVDVYWQIMNNWNVFIDYVWQFKYKNKTVAGNDT